MAGLSGLAGHELIHKRESYNKAIGAIPFTKILYTHFVLEHSSGHHRNVATREDPATARLGQTFYGFFPTSVYGGLKNTHLREVERIKTEYSEKCRQSMSGEKSSFEDDEVDTDATPILVFTS